MVCNSLPSAKGWASFWFTRCLHLYGPTVLRMAVHALGSSSTECNPVARCNQCFTNIAHQTSIESEFKPSMRKLSAHMPMRFVKG